MGRSDDYTHMTCQLPDHHITVKWGPHSFIHIHLCGPFDNYCNQSTDLPENHLKVHCGVRGIQIYLMKQMT